MIPLYNLTFQASSLIWDRYNTLVCLSMSITSDLSMSILNIGVPFFLVCDDLSKCSQIHLSSCC